MADSVSLLLCLRTSHIHMSIRRRRGRSPKFLVCQGVYLCDISKETRGDESYDTFPMSLSSKARRVRHFSRRYGSPDDWFLLMSPRKAKMSYVACVRRPSKPYSSEDTQGCRMSKNDCSFHIRGRRAGTVVAIMAQGVVGHHGHNPLQSVARRPYSTIDES